MRKTLPLPEDARAAGASVFENLPAGNARPLNQGQAVLPFCFHRGDREKVPEM